MMAHKAGDDWICPDINDAREEAGICTMQHCVEKRQDRVANCIATRPIWPHCVLTPTSLPVGSCGGPGVCPHHHPTTHHDLKPPPNPPLGKSK